MDVIRDPLMQAAWLDVRDALNAVGATSAHLEAAHAALANRSERRVDEAGLAGLVRRNIRLSGLSERAWAAKNGITCRRSLGMFLAGDRPPTPEVMASVGASVPRAPVFIIREERRGNGGPG